MKLKITKKKNIQITLSLEEAMVVHEALDGYPNAEYRPVFKDKIRDRGVLSWEIWDPLDDAIEELDK